MNRSTPQLPCHTRLRSSSESQDTASGPETLTPLSPDWTGRLEVVTSEEVAAAVFDERTSEWVCTDRVMKPDCTGWTVHDVTDGRSVGLGGVSLVGLSVEDAVELVDMLNRQELEIERTARQHVTQAAGRRPTSAQALPRS